MKTTRISLPEIGLIAGTRAAMGFGLGLILAGHLPDEQRRAIGWTLFLAGALSTVPLAIDVLGKMTSCERDRAERRQEPEAAPHVAESFEYANI
jgi:hypothetical protein